MRAGVTDRRAPRVAYDAIAWNGSDRHGGRGSIAVLPVIATAGACAGERHASGAPTVREPKAPGARASPR